MAVLAVIAAAFLFMYMTKPTTITENSSSEDMEKMEQTVEKMRNQIDQLNSTITKKNNEIKALQKQLFN